MRTTLAETIGVLKHALRTGDADVMRATFIPLVADYYVRPRPTAFERVRPYLGVDLILSSSGLAQAAAARLSSLDEVASTDVDGERVRVHFPEPLTR